MKLIDKSALVSEIDRQKIGYNTDGKHSVEYNTTRKILNIINTFEVKEVDLEKEVHKFIDKEELHRRLWDIYETAEYFFKLGLKAQKEDNVIGTIEREVKIDAGGYPYINCDIEFYDYDKDIPLAKEGDKVKVVIIKGE